MFLSLESEEETLGKCSCRAPRTAKSVASAFLTPSNSYVLVSWHQFNIVLYELQNSCAQLSIVKLITILINFELREVKVKTFKTHTHYITIFKNEILMEISCCQTTYLRANCQPVS